ncbi:cation:proton antiporter [Methylibium petroleiphilum]|uniref:cation:proton antiporter n=1 Tax=Methylibium petroleiphilum TaxID=105560 RepID=UPI001ACF9982|nr:monovalent cation/H(+) antiporter subunit G [Methylibium petroleiphilum]MBN9203651.1 monovalent cation/H(+) antiporter subunit G [Methylibium petroleiphilum]
MTGGDLRAALSLALIGAGMLFFLAGSIGVLRLPDLLSRLHALTKADNLGLGLVVLGLMLQARDAFEVLRLLLVWLLVLFASSVACYLVAHSATRAHGDPASSAGRAGPDRPGSPGEEARDGR